MKRFFKNKDSGAITPLPPNQPPTPSSFEVPREFDQYQRQQHRLSSPYPHYAEDGQDPQHDYSALPSSLRPGQVVLRHDLHHSVEPPSSHSRLSAPYTQQARSDQSLADTSSHSGPEYSSDEHQPYAITHTERRSSIPHQDGPRRRPSQRGHPTYASRESPYPVAGASHFGTTAYPVYSEEGEVMISQGHQDDDVHSEGKDKKKKLFGFSSSTRDKKVKSDREPPTETFHAHRSSDGPVPHSEPSHSRERPKEGWMDKWSKRAQQQQDHRLQDKELEGLVASKIGWLAANANTEEEWMDILPLIDMVSHSEAASKEAVRALRKEFKYGSVDTQRRAVRIWALLTLNSSDRFRFQVATKRFLDIVEETISSSKTPLSVKDTMLRVLGVLAFEFKDDSELSLITKCWNKAKPNDRPKNGEPLEDNLFEFRLPQPSRHARAPHQQQQPRDHHWLPQEAHLQQNRQQPRMHIPSDPGPPLPAGYELRDSDTQYARNTTQSHQQLHHQYQQSQLSLPVNQRHRHATSEPALVSPEQEGDVYDPSSQQRSWAEPFNTAPPASESAPRGDYDVVRKFEAMVAPESDSAKPFLPKPDAELSAAVLVLEEEKRRLYEQCQTGKSHANVLVDMMIHEDPDNNSAELVEEFYGKVLKSQELIVSQIPWASAQADQSRESLDQRRAIAASEHRPMPTGETDEERLLAELLDTHSRLTEASSLVDEMHRRIAEEEEERRVTERSKVEVRLDRSALAQDPVTGNLYDVQRGREAHNHLLEPYAPHQQASGSRSASPHVARSGTAQEHTFSPPPLVLSPPSAGSLGSAAPQSARVSRPLPVPRSEQSSDSNSAGAKHQHPPSLQTASHSAHSASRLSLNQSTGSGGSDSRTHSRDTSQSSQFAPSLTHGYRTALHPGSDSSAATNGNPASQNRSLPLTPPALNTSALRDREDEDDVKTPILPSEKALGKRRAVSVRYSSPPAPDPAQAFSRLHLDSK